MKVIASTLRKGNVVEKDGKLYVILFAENIHPGKGTPVTQLDMRRITDGVKVSERYRTTEQVERAFVEDREHTFLYSDGEGFHFMNPENYEQIAVPADVVGDAAPYLQEGMAVMLSVHNGVPLTDRAAAARDAGSHRDRAGAEGPDGLLVLQARHALERRAHHRAAAHRRRHPRRRHDGRRGLCRARQGLSQAWPGPAPSIRGGRQRGAAGGILHRRVAALRDRLRAQALRSR